MDSGSSDALKAGSSLLKAGWRPSENFFDHRQKGREGEGGIHMLTF